VSSRQTLMIEPCWEKRWQLRDAQSGMFSVEVANQDFSRKVAREMPVWVFVSMQGERVASSLPVSVVISEEGPDEECGQSAYVFGCERLHVFASGATYADAENSFHDQVVHFYHEYTEAHADELDEGAAAIKELYARYFRPSPRTV